MLERIMIIDENSNILRREQNGFRKNRSTTDNTFILQEFMAFMKSNEQPTYFAFLDFANAYDSVVRSALMNILKMSQITGKLWKLIQSTYEETRVLLKLNGSITGQFDTSVGLKQGSCLSPVYFCFYINEMLKAANESEFGVRIGNIKLALMAFADDLVVLAESPEHLQALLDLVSHHADKLGLKFGLSKSNVMVTNKSYGNNPNFILQGQTMAYTKEYKYLGTEIDKGGSVVQLIMDKTTRADRKFNMLRQRGVLRGRLSFEFKAKVYNAIILPGLLFSTFNSDILKQLEIVYRRHWCYLLNVFGQPPDLVWMGETGVLPIKYIVIKRVLAYSA